MTDQRTADGVRLRERIDQYLRESGLAGRNARVVPLTGDASDRKYFRIIAADGPSIVLALHAGPIDFATLPFANVVALLQRSGAGLASDAYLPYQIAFDVEKLMWELEFFTKHFIGGYRGVALGDAERSALTGEWATIAGELASEPRVLCHRDYHSRNLMLHDGSLYIIDFQDARMGPDTYDLVSLLRDSYIDFT